jgi:hypothetical protein
MCSGLLVLGAGKWDPKAVAEPGGFPFPWTDATKIYSDKYDLSFITPCIGAWAGDPQGEHCWMRAAFAGKDYTGQILGRASAGFGVCPTRQLPEEGNGTDCNTFVIQGAAAQTSMANLRFPFGSGGA